MKNKNQFINILGCIVGIVLILITILFLRNDTYKSISGIVLGIGSGIFGICLANYINNKMYPQNTEAEIIREIELRDERNILISEKSLSKSHSVMMYLKCLAMFVFILLDAPIYVLVVMAVLIFINGLLDITYHNYYNNRL